MSMVTLFGHKTPSRKKFLRKEELGALLFLLLLLLLAPQFSNSNIISAQTSGTTFTFSAAGDHNDSSDTTASLDLLAASGSSFYVALGDMSYATYPESQWCDYVKSHVGATFPFQLITGNHEDEAVSTDHGFIDNFAACLPDRLGATGDYGHQYYFDYPADQPLARFILIDADLNWGGVNQEYCRSGDTANCAWLTARIDEAKAQGLWVMVGMHKNCISLGIKSCEIGTPLVDLLISKRVDLVLQAHDHTYQRSKQLTCVTINSYNPACVADDGADNQYTRGAGTIFVIDGAFGAGLYDVSTADPEAGYFATWMGFNSNPRHGFTKYTVSATQISAEFVGSTLTSSFTDIFTIFDNSANATPTSTTDPNAPTPTPTSTPTHTPTPTPTPTPSQVLTFTPVDDASVIQGSPDTNYGSTASLKVDNSPAENFLLKFAVSGVNGRPVASAKLRLYNVNASEKGGDFRRVADNTWSEATVTWNTAPAADATILASLGAVSANTWYEVDITSLITGDGTFSLRVTSTSSNGADYTSKEGAAGFAPQLIVNVSETSTPIPTPTDTPTPSNTSTATDTPTSTATYTPTPTPTDPPTPTDTLTPSATPTPSDTPTSTHTPTPTSTDTPTPTDTLTPSATPTPTPTATFTSTPTVTSSATPTPTPTVTTTSADLIFADGFDTGNLLAWSSSTTDGSDLSVSAAAALVGSSGLQAVIDDNVAIYVTDDAPNAEPRYRARFYFDPNTITMASGDTHYIFYGLAGTSTPVVRVWFRFSVGNYQLRAGLRNDSNTWTNTAWFTIGDAAHFVEFDWRAATAAGANNGGLTLWIDGQQRADLTGIDNDTRRIDRVRLGPVAGIDTGTRGAYYFDAFESRRQTYIGPAQN